jgi:hypothetical protein
MRDIFLGPFRFWAIWIVVLGALYLAGTEQLHVTSFPWFLALLAGLAAAGVLGVVFTTREGERVTRDPIEPGQESPGS